MKSKSFTGISHVHSKYSFDGTLTIEELVDSCKKRGYSFVLLTEHAEGLDPERMKEAVRKCTDQSSENFLVIPGLEYNCEGMHILAIGTEEIVPSSSLPDLIKNIKASGGLAILAHTTYYSSISYEKLNGLNGIEMWNSRYDGRYAPSLKSLEALEEFRKRTKDIPAYGGMDVHKTYDLGKLCVKLCIDKLDRNEIIKSLKDGRFLVSNGIILLDSKRGPSRTQKIIFILFLIPYNAAKAARKAISRALGTLGIKIPESISSKVKKAL